MTPLHFGPPHRRLFGLLHPRDLGQANRGGVLIVMPFGHEAIRTYRFHRVLADRLARDGHDVLRFDHFGSGDSDGLDDEVRLAGWVEDVLQAHRILTAKSGVPVCCWVASRLGATVAMRAAATSGTAPRLVLWDPVIDGAAYLDELRQRHVLALEQSFSVASPRWREQLKEPQSFSTEAVGFSMSMELRSEILAVWPGSVSVAPLGRAAVLSSPNAQRLHTWLAEQGPGVVELTLTQDFDWLSDDSLNTALVPSNPLAHILRVVNEQHG